MTMRYLLLQIRDADDPILRQERDVFAEAIGCGPEAIAPLDVLNEAVTQARLDEADLVLVGGSGKYSVCDDAPWLDRTLEGLRLIYESRTPMFASCWGFQALARALGGVVIHDPARGELGTHPLGLTDAGRRDPLFGALPDSFLAHMGHEDHVIELPPGAIRLARSERVENQAYTFADRPIYATQFHPELTPESLVFRLRAYPEYLALRTGMTIEEFERETRPTPECGLLMRRFITMLAERENPAPISPPTLDAAPEIEPLLVCRRDAHDMQCGTWTLNGDEKTLALFTSEETAGGYVQAAGLGDGWRAFRPARSDLVEIFSQARAAGMRRAVLDPDHERARRIFDLDALLRAAGRVESRVDGEQR